MREILFRGKRKDNGEWICGEYITIYDDPKYKGIKTCIELNTGIYEVEPETVGQYTGLKDKNGTKILEGDIVFYNHRYYEIRYIEKYARFAPILPNTVFCVFAYDQGEVIGNIFDNPELIGGVEE